MLTSGQVSQMMAGQNQYFAGAAQYSQQISAGMPTPYQGGQGGGFSYAGGAPLGQEFASNLGNTAVSALGGAAQFGLGAAGIMAGFGMLGRAGGAALDPFVGGGAMYRMGGRMGLGMAGRLGMGAMGMVPALGLMAGASHIIGSAVSGAQEQSAVERTMGRHNFISPMGGGTTRSGARQVGDMMRQMQALPEMMTSMGELTRIMDKMGSMGMMQGMQNVHEFQRKFKESINVLREMSKVIGTSMEEALPMFGEIKRTGFYQTKDILQNAMSRQITGGITGMNQVQTGQLAAAGSQMSFATGGTRATGARLALRTANQLGMARQMGLLDEEQIMEMTGMGGAAGLQALSGQLTNASYRMSRGALGTATSIALAETEDGRFTGRMDQSLMERFQRGEIGRGELMRMARQKTRGRAAKMSYVARRQQLRSEMAGTMGVSGQMAMLQNILGERGFDDPDAMRIVSQRFGLGEREADLLVDMGQRWPEIQNEMKMQGRRKAKQIAQDAFMKENYSWDAIKRKTTKRIENVITKPFKDFGVGIRDAITGAVDEFVDDVTGRYSVEVTRGMSTLMRGALAGQTNARQRFGQLMQHTGYMDTAGYGGNLTPSRLGSVANWMTGTETAGERSLGVARAMGVDIQTGRSARGMQARGVAVLGADYNVFADDKFEGITRSDAADLRDRLMSMGAGETTERITAIQNLMTSNPELARAIQVDVEYLSSNRLHWRDRSTDKRIKSWAKGLKARGGTDSPIDRIRTMGAAAGIESLSEIEVAYAAAALRGNVDPSLKAAMTAEGRKMRGIQGGRARKDVADERKELASALRRSLGSETFGLVQEAFETAGGDAASDILFGVGGGKRAGLLTELNIEGGALVTFEGGRGARPITDEEFAERGSTEARARRVSRIIEGDDELRREVSMARTRGGDEADARRVIVAERMRGLAKEYAAARSVTGVGIKRFAKTYENKTDIALANANKDAFRSMVSQEKARIAVRKIADGKSLSKWDRQALQAYNIDPDALSTEDKDGVSKAEKMLKVFAALDSGDIDQNDIQKIGQWGKLGWEMFFAESEQEMNERGAEIVDKVKEIRGTMAGLDITPSEEAKEVLSRMEQLGTAWQGTLDKAAAAGTVPFGDIAAQIAEMKGPERAAMLRGLEGTGVGAAVFKYERTKRLMGRGRKRGTLAALGVSKEAFVDDPAAYQHLVGLAGGGEGALTRKLTDEQQEQIARYMASEATSKTLAASGVIQKSAYANQAEVANTLVQFTENVNSLAEIVQAMGGGETKGKKGSK